MDDEPKGSTAQRWVELADRLLSEVTSLSDPDLRQARVVALLASYSPRESVEVLQEIAVRAQARDSLCQELMLSLVNLARYESELGYERIADIYVLADDRGYESVKQLVASSFKAKKRFDPQGNENEYVERTLGERKAMATTTRDRDLLDRLMYDRNPQVIARLLQNPRITERDIVKVGAMRPTCAEVLTEIVNHKKWIRRYRVKKTIICNPYTPVNIALSLLGYMQKADLKEIAANTTLSEEVRNAAARRAREGHVRLDS